MQLLHTCHLQVDFVSVAFSRSAEDIEECRDLLKRYGSTMGFHSPNLKRVITANHVFTMLVFPWSLAAHSPLHVV